jgi:hypothetical protein
MIDKLIEIGRCYGMEMNVGKTKVMRISKQPFPVKIMIDQKQLENVESFKYLVSILTNDGRWSCEIKYRIGMAKTAFNKKRALFTSTLDLELRKKRVKCCIWSTTLYGAENWMLRAVWDGFAQPQSCMPYVHTGLSTHLYRRSLFSRESFDLRPRSQYMLRNLRFK